MRLVGSFKDPILGQKISLFLNSKGIEHQIDLHANQDWGSEEYGTVRCDLWVVEEEQYSEALKWFNQFVSHPFDPQLNISVPLPQVSLLDSDAETSQESVTSPPPMVLKKTLGKASTAILALCIFLFALSMLTEPSIAKLSAQLSPTPFVTSPINKKLMFDYPMAFNYLDQAIEKYGAEAVAVPSELPAAGKSLVILYLKTPYWKGFYADIVAYFRNAASPSINLGAPLFEKISQGEIWRLLTPCFLHADIFHILFNMMWLVTLGMQMEKLLGISRYLLFIILVGILSNSAQYLMSGANFIGFSGVICGMIGFIWKRQKIAPWEGYQLHRSTLLFISAFVLVVLSIQVVSFVLEGFGSAGFSSGIANTAHFSGAAVGYLLGASKFFNWKG